ncbi:hypothetical protein P8C59_007250 [Phyllachora maydis]|uniref:Cytochrome c oxidase subunit 8, mitochondrial n=1 Tax=Phyllachora maydis TaxID=1825666 RepID=A0AAD9I9V7_9PEZI|nr:hypothetical protein P8C59_007250 [Phyllachora maydis]
MLEPDLRHKLCSHHRQSKSTRNSELRILTAAQRREFKMLSRAAIRVVPRTSNSLVARRGFQTTRAQLTSPYHYPEGPRSNIPFNPKTRFFALRYWSFMGFGFALPFMIAVWQTNKPGK